MGELSYTTGGDANLVSFKSAARVPITSLKAHFLPKQDLHGYSKPWVGGSGKNLLDKNSYGFKAYDVLIFGGDSRQIDGTLVLNPDTYTISSSINMSAIYVTEQIDNSDHLISLLQNVNSLTFTLTEQTAIRLGFVLNGQNQDHDMLQYNYQLEKGSAATTYEPYENICPIEGWNSIETYKYCSTDCATNIIPSDYIKTEYLASTGLQYINTGILPFDGIGFDITYYTTNSFSSSTFGCIFGGRQATGSSDFQLTTYIYGNRSAGTLRYGYSNHSGIDYDAGMIASQKIHSSLRNHIYIDASNNTTSINTYNYSAARAIYLFGLNTNNKMEQSGKGCRIYHLTFYNDNNNTIIANFIPCRRKSDNKPGMYDTVSGTFYTNAGTGEFICGPDCGETIPVEFPVLGKNKLKLDVPDSVDSPLELNTKTKGKAYNISSNKWIDGTIYPYITNITVGTDTISFTEGQATAYGVGYCLALIPNQTYSLSATSNYGSANIYFFTKNKEYISRETNILNASFTVPTNAYYSYINLSTSQKNVTVNYSNIQLELGDTATTYESYNPNNTVYGGYIDVAKGELVQTFKKIILDGSIEFSYKALTTTSRFAKKMTELGFPNGCGNVSVYFSYLEKGVEEPWHARINISSGSANAVLQIYMPTSYNSKESFSTFLSEHPLEVCIRNPIEITYPLTSTKLKTLLSQNHIWSNTNSTTSVSYAIHDAAPIRAARARIAANEPHIETASGTVATFNTDMSAPLKECKIHFSPMQDLHGYDRAWIAGGGKNLLDMASENIVIGKYINNSGVVTGNNNNFYNSKYIPVKASTAYTLSTSQAISYCSFMEYDVNKDFIQRTLFGKSTPAITSETITTTANTAYVLIGSNVKYATINVNDVQAISWQFEEGSSATSYAPYENVCPIGGWTGINMIISPTQQDIEGQTIPIDWITEAGTVYGGYIDLVNGEVVAEWHKIVADGINIKANSSYNRPDYNRFGAGIVYNTPAGICYNSTTKPVLCDILPVNPGGYGDLLDVDQLYAPYAGALYVVFYVGRVSEHPEITTNTQRIEFTNAWLQEHPTTIAYKLKDPIHYQLTSTQLRTLRGQNNIWSNANGNIEIQYWRR